MKKSTFFAASIFLAMITSSTLLLAESRSSQAKSPTEDMTQKIEQLTGSKGYLNQAEGVFKVSLPRKDIQAVVAGSKVTPPMGLTCWAAFKLNGEQSMMMGDMVLLEDQVNPVIDVAQQNGLEITALHNHFFWDSPKVKFMHIGGMGSPEVLAAAVGKVFSKIKEPATETDKKDSIKIDPAKTTLSPKVIEDILGLKGDLKDGVYKLVVGRKTTMDGVEMGNAMGVNTWAAFAGSDEAALVDGDFAMLQSEVQDVIRALRTSGINVVAIHNHMFNESPRIIFLHFWGTGSTSTLAKGLKAALDSQKK
jgi:hypothetical protein